MERWVAKVLALLGTFLIPFVCTLLPLKVNDLFVRRGKQGAVLLSWMMCFGGGVFFATYILHMAPETREILNEALVKPYHIDYPVADLIMAFGFFMVLFIEKAAVSANHKKQLKKARSQQGTRCQCVTGVSVGATNGALGDHISVKLDENNVNTRESHVGLMSEVKMIPEGDNDGHNHDFDAHASRSFVLILALSLHRIFEGMSVGLKSSVIGVWNLFIAVMCHESVIGFSLGLQFVKNEFGTKRMVVTSLFCSLIMPVGVAIGTAMVETGEPDSTLDLVNGILQAIATGTFIYVTFFEILQGEISHSDTGIGKIVAMFLGFGLMALLCLVPEGSDFITSGNSTIALVNATTAKVP